MGYLSRSLCALGNSPQGRVSMGDVAAATTPREDRGWTVEVGDGAERSTTASEARANPRRLSAPSLADDGLEGEVEMDPSARTTRKAGENSNDYGQRPIHRG
jgi:hypothetical protein